MLLIEGHFSPIAVLPILRLFILLTVTMVIMLNKPCYIYQLSVLYILEIFFINFWGIFPQSLNDILCYYVVEVRFCVRYTMSTSIFMKTEKAFKFMKKKFHECGSWISILRKVFHLVNDNIAQES